MQAKTIKEVLIATRWIIDNFGWCQKTFFRNKDGISTTIVSKENSSCLSGAMMLVNGQDDAKNGAYRQVYSAILGTNSLTASPNSLSVTGWNDAKGRTKQEVIALLDSLIAKA